MYKITLEIASNGIIKTIEDDNSNGGGEHSEEKIVYQLEDDGDSEFENTIDFLCGICEDMGVDTGSKNTRRTLAYRPEFGEGYVLSDKELNNEIAKHQYELKWLKEELKERKLIKQEQK
jgi:hypothetical protein